MENKTKGEKGELIAKRFLEEKNYTIVKSNYRCTSGEIDIIAKDGEYLVFVEVKYRTNKKFGMPVEAIDRKKQEKIRVVAGHYLSENNIKSKVRIDVIGILNTNELEINHIENAF